MTTSNMATVFSTNICSHTHTHTHTQTYSPQCFAAAPLGEVKIIVASFGFSLNGRFFRIFNSETGFLQAEMCVVSSNQ